MIPAAARLAAAQLRASQPAAAAAYSTAAVGAAAAGLGRRLALGVGLGLGTYVAVSDEPKRVAYSVAMVPIRLGRDVATAAAMLAGRPPPDLSPPHGTAL